MPGPARRDTSGISFVKKSGNDANAVLAPREITDHNTSASGTNTARNAAAISPVISALFVARQLGFGDRSSTTGSCSPLVMTAALRSSPSSAARSRWRPSSPRS